MSFEKCVFLDSINPCGSSNFPYGCAMTLREGMKYVDRLIDEGLELEYFSANGLLFGSMPVPDEDLEYYSDLEEPLFQRLCMQFPSQFVDRLAFRWKAKIIKY